MKNFKAKEKEMNGSLDVTILTGCNRGIFVSADAKKLLK